MNNQKQRASHARYTPGFTIVELLIVILATITIVAFNGVNTLAEQATLNADLSAAGVSSVNLTPNPGLCPQDAGVAVESFPEMVQRATKRVATQPPPARYHPVGFI